MLDAAIKALNLPTPGRIDEAAGASDGGAEAADRNIHAAAVEYLKYLGGAGNIDILDSCVTRLRLVLRDPSKIDEPMLKKTGAMGIVKSEKGVQVIVGTRAELIASEMKVLAGK